MKHEHHDSAPKERDGGVFAQFDTWFEEFTGNYGRTLDFVLRRRATVVMSSLLLLAFCLGYMGPNLRRDFFPEVDSGSFEMTVRAPSGSSLLVTEERVAEVEELIRETIDHDLEIVMSEVGAVADWSAAYTPNAGPMDGVIKVQLTHHRHHSAQEYVRMIRDKMHEDFRFADIEIGFDSGGMIRSAMNGGKSTPINIRVTGKNLEMLRGIAQQVQNEIKDIDGIVDARILQRLDYPQYMVDIDRDRAADLELPLPYVVKNIVAALNSSIQFNKKNFFIDPISKGQYYVGVQYAEDSIESLETLLDIPITSPSQGQSIPLRNIVTVRKSTVPTEVVHQDLQSGIELVLALDGRDLGHVADEVAGVIGGFGVRQSDGTWAPYLEKIGVSSPGNATATVKGVRIEMSGEYIKMKDMFVNLGGGLALAALLVYLLLVTLFQSFRLPLAIIGGVPFGLIGVVLMLYATGTAINVQSLLGVIFMVGVVVANTVILIDCAQNLRRTEALSANEAIRKAAVMRVRPILMTAIAALLALTPMALALARGSESNAPLGRAVIGGLIAGVISTLIIVPCLYVWFSDRRRQRAKSNGGAQAGSKDLVQAADANIDAFVSDEDDEEALEMVESICGETSRACDLEDFPTGGDDDVASTGRED